MQFLTRLPTRQDGVENRNKVYLDSGLHTAKNSGANRA